MNAAEVVSGWGREQFAGLTIHERVKKVTNRLAQSGYRVTRLTLPPGLFSSLEYVPYPFLTGCETGLALMLLGEKVPLFPRYDDSRFVRFEFYKIGEAQMLQALEIDLDPPKVE